MYLPARCFYRFSQIKLIDPQISRRFCWVMLRMLSFPFTRSVPTLFSVTWVTLTLAPPFLPPFFFLPWHPCDRSMTTFLRRSLQLQNMMNLLGTRLAWYILGPDEYDAVCPCEPLLSFSSCTPSHYHAQQPFLHKVNLSMSCTTVTTVHHSHSGETIKSTVCSNGATSLSVYSYYPVCRSINTPDQ